MADFVYPLSTTGSVSWASILSDLTGALTPHIAAATASRARLRGALKANRHTTALQQDYNTIVKAVQDYVPYLYSIQSCLESDALVLKQEPAFSWRTTLLAHAVRSTPRITLRSIHHELAFVLLTYALALANMATINVRALGHYEHQRHTSDLERRRMDEIINVAADTLCRASGILTHLSDHVIPLCESAVPDAPAIKIPEITRDVTSALAKLCLADAERLAIRRLLSRAVADIALSPGPPLPRSHPSPSLLAKLNLNVYALYDATRNLIKSHDAQLNGDLRRYLATGRSLALARAYKWLGVDAGESGRVGEAIAWLQLGRDALDESAKRGAAMRLGAKARDKRDKVATADDLTDLDGFAKAYAKLNDTVSFEPVPTGTSLLARVPTGRAALAVKPFTPPPLLFGPGRSAVPIPPLDAALAGLELDDVGASDSEGDDAPTMPGSGAYVGQGGYY